MGMAREVELRLNGETVRVEGLSPTTTLLQFLRKRGYAGSKEGCAEGDCGACTVAVVGQGLDGKPRYQAMNACLIPLGAMAGREVVSVEGLSSRLGPLHPVQEAMVKTGGSQCGYCTPGFIMSMFAAYYEGKVDDEALEGNLCRCTGYLPIRRAAAMLEGPPEDDPFLKRLKTSPPLGSLAYRANGQRFFRPAGLEETLKLLQDFPEARLVAGATDMGLEFSKLDRHPAVLVSLEAVTELKVLEGTETHVELGAGLTLSELEEVFHDRIPALDEMLKLFAARQIQNRATVGGNLGTASPIGDLAPVFLSLDAELQLAGPDGERYLPIADFFTGYRRTALKPGEIIVSVRIPKALVAGAVRRLSRSYKASKRPADDISTVAAAFALDLGEDDHEDYPIVRARLAYGGVAATPARALTVEAALVGKPWNRETFLEVKPLLSGSFTPLSDLRGGADYRRKLVVNLFEKFLYETREAAGVAA
jgi:xanthine dehydrogenase small subunit